MNTPGPTYKMSRAIKTWLAVGRFKDKAARWAFKQTMIAAELESKSRVARAPRNERTAGPTNNAQTEEQP